MLTGTNIQNDDQHEGIEYQDHGREMPRKSVLWRAYIHIKGHKFSCQIRNLSVGGLKIKLDVPFKENVLGVVEIPKFNVMLRAQIAWQSEGFFGLEFLDDHEAVRHQFCDGAAILGVDAVNFMKALG